MAITDSVIYCRMSRDRAGAGLAVARQEADCRPVAERLGLAVREVYADNDMSAYTGKPRKGYDRMMADLAGSPAHVIAWHTDRLTRRPMELEDYIQFVEPRGILTYTATTGPLDLATASGRLVARALAAVNRYEVEHMSERHKAVKAARAGEGAWSGGRRPYGFDADGVTVRADEAAEIIRATAALLAGASLRSLVRDLNERGVTTATGRPWISRSLSLVLQRPRNAGLRVHRGEIAGHAGWGRWMDAGQTEWGCLISEGTYRELAAMLAGRATGNSSDLRHLGSGLYLCGVCGSPLRAYGGRGAGAYRCRNPLTQQGRHVSRRGDVLDEYVASLVLAWADANAGAIPLRAEGDGDSLVRAEIRTLRRRLDEQAALHAMGKIDARQLAEGSRVLRPQLADAEKRAAAARRQDALSSFRSGREPADAWRELDIPRRQAVIRELMEVTVLPARKGRPPGGQPGGTYFRTEYVRVDWRQKDQA